MTKVILLPATGTAPDASVFTTGLAVARLLDGHLAVLHVRPDVRRDIIAMAAGDMGSAAGLDTAIATMEQEANDRARAAEAAWQDFAKRNGIMPTESPCATSISYEWLTETGEEAGWLAEYGRTSDIVVVGRGRGAGPGKGLMEAALMDTGKPLLIAPATSSPLLDGALAIAWKDTREAAHAVAAATPFIRWATRVVVFTVPENEDAPDTSHQRLARTLRWHNPNVTVQTLSRSGRAPAQVLMDAVQAAGCGLLVMGGYGHTRLREAVFGGFTRAILEQAPVAVLMAH